MNFHRRLKVGLAKIRVAIAGVGNCASAIIQGVHYYEERESEAGLTYGSIGGYTPDSIEFVSAFDVSSRKVGKDLAAAILQKPNNTPRIANVPKLGVTVKMGPLLYRIGNYPNDDPTVSREARAEEGEQPQSAGAARPANAR